MIHFYFGNNDFAIKRQIDSITEKFAKKHGAENITKIEGGEIDSQKLLAEIVNINLFALNRLIILDGVSKNKTAWSALGENLERVPAETELIIVDESPDKRTKTFKSLKDIARVTDFPSLKNYQLSEFVMREAADQGVEMKKDAIGELIAYTDGNQWRIASEIMKFRALDKLVTSKTVRDHVEPEANANVFKLLDDLLNGRREMAMAELTHLRKIEDPNRFFALLASQVFALSAAINSRGRAPSEIAVDIGAHPFVMEKMCVTARKMRPRDVARISKIVAETDAKMKSTGNDPWTLVELALAKI